jgi:hypothetical protein
MFFAVGLNAQPLLDGTAVTNVTVCLDTNANGTVIPFTGTYRFVETSYQNRYNLYYGITGGNEGTHYSYQNGNDEWTIASWVERYKYIGSNNNATNVSIQWNQPGTYTLRIVRGNPDLYNNTSNYITFTVKKGGSPTLLTTDFDVTPTTICSGSTVNVTFNIADQSITSIRFGEKADITDGNGNILLALSPEFYATHTITPGVENVISFTVANTSTTTNRSFDFYVTPYSSATDCNEGSAVASSSVNVTTTAPPTADITAASPNLCAGSAYTMNPAATVTTGATYSYYWKSDGYGVITNGNSLTPTYTSAVADAGNTVMLTLIAKNSNCVIDSAMATLDITVNAKPEFSFEVPDALCSPATFNLATGLTLATGSTAGLDYTYFTNPECTTPLTDETAVGAGTYYIVGATAENCTDTTSVTIVVNTKPTTPTVSDDIAVCLGSNVDLTSVVTGTADLKYYEDNTGTTGVTTPAVISGLTVDDYIYYVRSEVVSNGITCNSDFEEINVTVNTLPAKPVVKVRDTTFCLDESIDLAGLIEAAPAGDTNIFYDAIGGTPLSLTVLSFDNQTSVQYYVQAKNLLTTCVSDWDSVRVNVNPLPEKPGTKNTAICYGSAVTLDTLITSNTELGDTILYYTSMTGNPLNTITVTPLTDTKYYVQAKNKSTGCVSELDTITVTVIDLPNVTVTPKYDTVCSETWLEFVATGAHTYIWLGVVPGDAFSLYFDNPKSTPELVSIEVEGTATNGCTATDTAYILVNPLPTIITLAFTDSLCEGDAIVDLTTISDVTDAGGTYSFNSIEITNAEFDPAYAGKYEIVYTYTNANGCVNSAKDTLVVNGLPDIDITQVAPMCLGDFADITATPAGGDFSGTGVTTDGRFTPTVEGVQRITYTYTDPVTGCTNSEYIDIAVNELPDINNASVCLGGTHVLEAPTACDQTIGATTPASPTNVSQISGWNSDEKSWTLGSAAGEHTVELCGTVFGDGNESQSLLLTGFNFNLPNVSDNEIEITGIEISFERKRDGGWFNLSTFQDHSIGLVLDGSKFGTQDQSGRGTNWTSTYTQKTYGGITSTWGATLTKTIVDSNSFGLFFTAEAKGTGGNCDDGSVRNFTVTVHYKYGGAQWFTSATGGAAISTASTITFGPDATYDVSTLAAGDTTLYLQCGAVNCRKEVKITILPALELNPVTDVTVCSNLPVSEIDIELSDNSQPTSITVARKGNANLDFFEIDSVTPFDFATAITGNTIREMVVVNNSTTQEIDTIVVTADNGTNCLIDPIKYAVIVNPKPVITVRDTNLCIGSDVPDLRSMVEMLNGYSYKFYEEIECVTEIDPVSHNNICHTQIVYHVQQIDDITGCMSDVALFTANPVDTPEIEVFVNGTLLSTNTYLYNVGDTAKITVTLKNGKGNLNVPGLVITKNGIPEYHTPTDTFHIITCDSMCSNIEFAIVEASHNGCTHDISADAARSLDFTYALLVAPQLIVTSSPTACDRDAAIITGTTINICQGDLQAICAWVDTNLVASNQTWGVSFTNQTTGKLVDMVNTQRLNPYSMLKTDTMSVGFYEFTINEISILEVGVDPITTPADFVFNVNIVKPLEVTAETPATMCSFTDFNLPVTVTGGMDSVIVEYSINGGAAVNTIFYHVNDTARGLIPVTGQAAFTDVEIEILSLTSNPCDLILTNEVYTVTFDTLPELVALNTISDTIGCDWMELEIGSDANCHIGEIVKIKIEMDVTDMDIEYYEITNSTWYSLKDLGVLSAGVGYFGGNGFPLQDILTPNSGGTLLRMRSTSQLFVDSVYYNYSIVLAADSSLISTPMEGYFYLLGYEVELLDLDTIVEMDTLKCAWVEFEIGSRANCHEGDLANVLIAMDVTGVEIEYWETGIATPDWVSLNQSFKNDTCYFGPTNGFPLQNLYRGEGSKFRIRSATPVFIPNVDYSFVVVDGNKLDTAWSAPLEGSFAVLGTKVEMLDFDTIANIKAVVCTPEEFVIGTRANCFLGDSALIAIQLDTTGLLLEYYETYNNIGWTPLNQRFINGICYWGPTDGFPLQDLLEKTEGSRFKISSTGYTTIPSVNYSFTVVNAKDVNEAWSDAIIGTFELRALPLATITDPFDGTVCNGTTVEYVTEKDMAVYAWTITPGTNGTEYSYSGETTNTFEVQWLMAGDYTVSIAYTDTNDCSSSADSAVTVLEIPKATLALASTQALDNCPYDNVVNLELTATNVNTPIGPWRVVYSAIGYDGNVVKTYTKDSAIGSTYVTPLQADNLPAGKYRFVVDTIIDLASTVQCPGVLNDTTTTVVNVYPEIDIQVTGTQPSPICANEKHLYIILTPDSLMFANVNPAIPNYNGFKAWIEAPNGSVYPVVTTGWTKTDELRVAIPDTAFEAGQQTFKILYAEVTVDGSTMFCKDSNIHQATFDILQLPVVEIVGPDTVCGVTPSGITYEYTTSIDLDEYKWSWETKTGTGTVILASESLVTDSAIVISFSDTGYYQIYLAAKDSACENYDTLDVYVTPNPQLVDINDFLANLDYVNCKTQEFAIGSIGNCRLGQDARVLIALDSADKMLVEYYEYIGNAGWTTINFINDTAYFHPTIGQFPITTTTDMDSLLFRITSVSDTRIEPINYSFVFVNGADSSEVWSDPIAGSFILTPADTAAQIALWTLDSNTIVNCTDQTFAVEITPNCQEGNPAQLRFDIAAADLADIKWAYSLDNGQSYPHELQIGHTIVIDSLIAGGANDTLSTIYFQISSINDSARDIVYSVFLEDTSGTFIWDSIVDYRIRLAKNDPLAMTMIQAPVGDSVICFEQEIKIAYDPNCLLSDTNMGKLVISADMDITGLMEISHEGNSLSLTHGTGYYREFIDWPGAFNKYADTLTLTVRSINPATTDVDVTFYFRIVDTASTYTPPMVEIPNSDNPTPNQLPTVQADWKIKGRPVTPIFAPDTIGYCQANRYITFPEATNQPANSVYVWTNADGNVVPNAHIGTYGVYDFTVQYFDTNTGCYSDDTLFVIDVSSDPNVLRMTSFVYCKEDTTEPFVFHDYFTENSPNVEYEYRGIGDPTWYNNNGFPYNGFDTIPSFVAYNSTLVPLVLTYEVIATDVNDTCNSGRNRKEFTITINPQPRIPVVVADMVYCNGVSVDINNSPFPANNAQYVYEWVRSGGDTIFANRADTGSSAFAFTAINNSNDVISATYTVTPRFANYNESCGVDTVDFTISVLPTPKVDPMNQVSYCSGEEVATTIFAGVTANTTYEWEKLSGGYDIGADVNGTSGTDSIPAFTAANNTANTTSATYRVTPVIELNGARCEGTAIDYIINVLPAPTVYPIADQTICSGTKMASVTFTGTASSYQWRNDGDAISGLPTTTITGNTIIDYTLINNTDSIQRAKIVVKPSNSPTCVGDSAVFTIEVYPQPKVDDIADITACANGQLNAITFTTTPSTLATTYSWRNTGDNIIGLPANGTNSIAQTTLRNTGSTALTAVIEVTPKNNNDLCVGLPKTFSITVYPEPTLTNLPSDDVLCSGDRTTSVSFAGSSNLYKWTARNVGSVTGLPAGNQYGNFGTYTLVNSGTTAQTISIDVTPMILIGVGDTCKGTIQTFNIIVNPALTLTQPQDQNICNGAQMTAITFTGTGTVNWTVTGDQLTGLPASGTGNITARALYNTTSAPLVATVTATSTFGGCTSVPVSFNITVNPNPTLTNKPSNATMCSGDVYPAITFAGNATEFAWTVTNTTGTVSGLPTSGTNVFGAYTLTNAGASAATATVSITPKYVNGTATCTATAETFTITVNPAATITNTPADAVVCHNQAVSYTFGANVDWTATGDLITGLPLSGTNTLSGTLENRGTTSLTAVITLTPKSGTCTGTPYQFKITVNPEPVVNNVPADYTICNNGQTTPFTFTGVATEYQWSVSANTNISGFPTGTQTGNFGTYLLTNSASTPQMVTVTVTPHYNHGGATSCPGASKTFDITVNPAVEITNTLNDLELCDGQSTGTITFAGATSYEWTITGDRISGLPTGTQTGNFGPYTVTNTGTATLHATVTVTSRYVGGGVNCTGNSVSFDIIVGPSTRITANASANKTSFCVGETLELTVGATGDNLSYQWYKDGNAIAGATSADYEVSNIQLSDAGDYSVTINGTCGSPQSEIIPITVGAGDMLLEKWTDIIFVDNYAQLYTAYQWYKDGKILDGATKQFYHEPGGLKGCYYVVLTLASGGTITSCEKCYDNTKLATKDWKLTVYPNPSKQGSNATGILLSNDDVRYDGQLNVTIHNMNGAEVLRMNKVEGQFDVETIQLAPGVYNVRVVTEEGKIYNEKMIVY